MMNHIGEKLFNISSYSFLTAGIFVNLDNIKSVVLFIVSLILAGMQMRLTYIKIKKEKQNKDETD